MQEVWHVQNRTGTCPKKGSSTLFLCDGHKWWSSRQRLSSKNEKETMAKTEKAPWFVHVGNVLTTILLRAGVKLVGPGNYPAYLFTVRGRKSGQPRTIPIVILEQNGKRYLASPYGNVNWVRNLRAAREAILTRGRRSETVTARELPKGEAALVLRADIKRNPFARNYGVTADSSLEEFERAAASHPLFVLEKQ
jgi:deazaflavin-dependent oxidoreductase (nitroreductase family)